MVSDVERNEEAALLPRLRVIEAQSLDSRATAYAQLHDELKGRLEGRDSFPSNA